MFLSSVFYNEVCITVWTSLLKFIIEVYRFSCLYYDSSHWVGNGHIEASEDIEEEEENFFLVFSINLLVWFVQ